MTTVEPDDAAAPTDGERFAREAHRQSAEVAAADRLSDDQAFLEAVSVRWDD